MSNVNKTKNESMLYKTSFTVTFTSILFLQLFTQMIF